MPEQHGAATTPDSPGAVAAVADHGPLRVWVDQQLCTGDGLCVQYAPEVFEFDVDGIAYVKDDDGQLLLAEGARTAVPPHLRLDVLDSARECPGECIHVETTDGTVVAGGAAEPG